MGAVDFRTFEAGGGTLDEAYRRAVDDAHFQYGHDPYNGTISTTNGAIRVATRTSLPEARELAQQYWDYEDSRYDRHAKPNPLGHYEVEKWGPALAIQVEGDEPGWYFFGLAAC